MAPTSVDAHADFEGILSGKDAQILGKFRGQIDSSPAGWSSAKGRGSTPRSPRTRSRSRASSRASSGRAPSPPRQGRVDGSVDAQSLSIRDGALLNGAVNAGAGGPRPAPPAGSRPGDPPRAGAAPGLHAARGRRRRGPPGRRNRRLRPRRSHVRGQSQVRRGLATTRASAVILAPTWRRRFPASSPPTRTSPMPARRGCCIRRRGRRRASIPRPRSIRPRAWRRTCTSARWP